MALPWSKEDPPAWQGRSPKYVAQALISHDCRATRQSLLITVVNLHYIETAAARTIKAEDDAPCINHRFELTIYTRRLETHLRPLQANAIWG